MPPAVPARPAEFAGLRLAPLAFKVDLGSTSAIQVIDDLFRRDFDLVRRLLARDLAQVSDQPSAGVEG